MSCLSQQRDLLWQFLLLVSGRCPAFLPLLEVLIPAYEMKIETRKSMLNVQVTARYASYWTCLVPPEKFSHTLRVNSGEYEQEPTH